MSLKEWLREEAELFRPAVMPIDLVLTIYLFTWAMVATRPDVIVGWVGLHIVAYWWRQRRRW